MAFVFLFVFENFMFHDWRIYEYYEARHHDLGVFDKSNIPITQHNMKLFTMLRTETSMDDFIQYVKVDISDAIRDNKTFD